MLSSMNMDLKNTIVFVPHNRDKRKQKNKTKQKKKKKNAYLFILYNPVSIS